MSDSSKSLPSAVKDITGQRFGRLIPLRYEGNSQWYCRCDCGTFPLILSRCMVRGTTRSCGCLRSETSKRRFRKDLLGRRFGRLLVLELAGNATTGRCGVLWRCRCDCGTVKDVLSNSLIRGLTKSCGCLMLERAAERQTRHGLSTTPEHGIWCGMRDRCLNPKARAYRRYGERGITICARWAGNDGFQAFYADMGPRPSSEYSIDRIDNDQGYFCGHCQECRAEGRAANCRWATSIQQQQNRRDTRHFTVGDETLCLSEWARRTGISPSTLTERIHRGMTMTEALADVVQAHRKRPRNRPRQRPSFKHRAMPQQLAKLPLTY